MLHKLGQVLARDERIWPDLREELRRLECLPPAAWRADLEEQVREAFPASTVFGRPVAEGSLAVVLPFRLDVTEGKGQQG